jgi:outer membrane protein OmpA-like peptidoglycan-associated protein
VSLGYWFGIKDSRPDAPSRTYRDAPDVSEHESDRDGDGFPDSIDKCPDVAEDGAEPDPTDGCPAGADRDHDGIPDNVDRCPDDPEDKDGVEDQDGCPEQDADNDKIPDAEDKCPTEPGPASEIAEKHGCPSLTRVEEDGTIALLEPIQFETARSTIKPVSFPILDEVVALMKARPNLRIGVYGHTDNRGSRAMNMRLSAARAASCVKYIVGKGIKASRLESDGFGFDKPVDTNDTPEGRAKNRRTEFKMLNMNE